jgi:hypothetical protein
MPNTELLSSVTTPLALAALCLLAGSGVLTAVSKQRKPTRTMTLTIHWGFILALALGTLANVSYVVIASFGREIRIAGTVRDDAGKALPRAVVDIPGRGRGISDDYGAFEFSVPDSRKADDYEGIATLDGYGAAPFKLKGPQPKQTLSLTLTQPKMTPEGVIRHPEKLFIGHYLGMPQVDVTLGFSNPMPNPLKLENIALAVTSPAGKVFELPMVGSYAPNGVFNPFPLSTLELVKSQNFSVGYRFFRGSPAHNEVMFHAQSEFPMNQPQPQLGQLIFSEAMKTRFVSLLEREFIWSAGTWGLTVTTSVQGFKLERRFTFALAPAEITKMKSVTQYYRTGYSTLPALPAAPDGNSNVSVVVLK